MLSVSINTTMKKDKLNIEEFSLLVSEIVCLIPPGRATSYGVIARTIGYPALSRMVGKVLSNSATRDIPAHRVVNSQGVLSGKDAFGTPSKMKELLEMEGVVIENNRIKNWKTVFWNPMEELNL